MHFYIDCNNTKYGGERGSDKGGMWLGECIEGEWLVGSEATDRVGLVLTRISPVFILLTEFDSFNNCSIVSYRLSSS